MLDLVNQETTRIDSRFLEPACGKGNFLTEILERKLGAVQSRYGNNKLDFDEFTLDTIGREIYDGTYGSKVNRLRAFWQQAGNGIVGKLMGGPRPCAPLVAADHYNHRRGFSPPEQSNQRSSSFDIRHGPTLGYGGN